MKVDFDTVHNTCEIKEFTQKELNDLENIKAAYVLDSIDEAIEFCLTQYLADHSYD